MISIRFLKKNDISSIASQFAQHNWPKPISTFQTYLDQQQAKERIIWVGCYNDNFAGYVTLKWQSHYEPFLCQNIPEIMDLNVLPPYQKQGIGAALLKTAENAAFEKSRIVGIGVGLYADYGSAQRLYVKNGYIPDGHGITYNYKPVVPGTNALVNDDLVLWFTKQLKFGSTSNCNHKQERS